MQGSHRARRRAMSLTEVEVGEETVLPEQEGWEKRMYIEQGKTCI